jgi:hypothetical protein
MRNTQAQSLTSQRTTANMLAIFLVAVAVFDLLKTCEATDQSCDDASCMNVQGEQTSLMQVKKVVTSGMQRAQENQEVPNADAMHLDIPPVVFDDTVNIGEEFDDMAGNSTLREGAAARYRQMAKVWVKALSKSKMFSKSPMAEGEEEFCWLDTYPQFGTETQPSACSGDTRRVNRFGLFPGCYGKCDAAHGQENHAGITGSECHAKCPNFVYDPPGSDSKIGGSAKYHWRDDGEFCRLPEYGRGFGYFRKRICEQENPRGCEQDNLVGGITQLWYPKCRGGFKPVGCCICAPAVDSAVCKRMLGPESSAFLDSCKKPIARAWGQKPACGPGTEPSGLLCYPKCPEHSSPVGPVCWYEPPTVERKKWVQCGMGAAKDDATCAEKTTDQVFSALKLIVNIASLGAAAPGTHAIKEAEEHAESIFKMTKTVIATFQAITAIKEAHEEGLQGVTSGEGGAAWETLKIMGTTTEELASESNMKIVEGFSTLATAERPEDVVRGAAQIANHFDPTGIANVVSAYTFPKCNHLEKMFTSVATHAGNFARHVYSEVAERA